MFEGGRPRVSFYNRKRAVSHSCSNILDPIKPHRTQLVVASCRWMASSGLSGSCVVVSRDVSYLRVPPCDSRAPLRAHYSFTQKSMFRQLSWWVVLRRPVTRRKWRIDFEENVTFCIDQTRPCPSLLRVVICRTALNNSATDIDAVERTSGPRERDVHDLLAHKGCLGARVLGF